MLIYIINLFLVVLYGRMIKSKKVLVWTIGIQMFLILALRDMSVGSIDLQNYSKGYEFISHIPLSSLLHRLHFVRVADLQYPFAYESGFTVFIWLVSKTGASFQVFLILYDLIVVSCVSYFIYSSSDDVSFSFLLFIGLGMFTYSFYILRQTLAVSILLIASLHIHKRNLTNFWILFVLAFMIHRASFIFLFAFLFRNVTITKKRYNLFFMFSLWSMAVTPLMFSIVIVPILKKLGKMKYANMHFQLNNQILMMLAIAVLILMFNNFRREDIFDFLQDNKESKKVSFMLYSFLISINFEILGMCNDGFARIIEFLYIYIIILVPKLLKKNASHSRYLIYRNGITAFLILFYMYTLKGSYIVPYKVIGT